MGLSFRTDVVCYRFACVVMYVIYELGNSNPMLSILDAALCFYIYGTAASLHVFNTHLIAEASRGLLSALSSFILPDDVNYIVNVAN